MTDFENRKYILISAEELKHVLDGHKDWLQSNGTNGAKAELRNVDLEHGDFRKRDLRKADLGWSCLQEADLSRANLQEAILRKADLQGAELRNSILFKANLEEANLQDAILSRATLLEADLYSANLLGADLQNSNLQEARLGDANLQEANLLGANLKDTDLQRANLQGADLRGAVFSNTDLRGADLRDANVEWEDLAGAYLVGANLGAADFHDAVLQGAEFLGVSLQWANFQGANLFEAYLQESNLQGADFSEADLSGVDFQGSILRSAVFENANLAGTDFCDVDLSSARYLTQSQIELAIGDFETLLPDHLVHPEHWLAPTDGPHISPDRPTIPVPAPAPVTTRIIDEKVVLDDTTEPHSSSDRSNLRTNWEVLRQDADRLTPRLDNVPGMARRVEDYIEALEEDFEQLNEILLGLRGEALSKIVAQAENEILSRDALGELEGLVANHKIFMRHFPKWLRHIAPNEGAHLTPEVVEKSKPAVDIVIKILKEEALVDVEIPTTLESLEEMASDQEGLDRPAWLGVHRGLADTFNSLARLAVGFGTGVSKDLASQASRKAAKFLLSLATSGLSDLIEWIPAEYEWLDSVLVYLKRISDGDASEK